MNQIHNFSLSGTFANATSDRPEREPLLHFYAAATAEISRGDTILRSNYDGDAKRPTLMNEFICSINGDFSLNYRFLSDYDWHAKHTSVAKKLGVVIPLNSVVARSDNLNNTDIARVLRFSSFNIVNDHSSCKIPTHFSLQHINGARLTAKTQTELNPRRDDAHDVHERFLNLLPSKPMSAAEWTVILAKLCDNLQLASIVVDHIHRISIPATCFGSSRLNWKIRSTFKRLGWKPGIYRGPNKPNDVESLPAMICPLDPDQNVWITHQNGMSSSEIRLHLAMGNPNLADLTYYRKLIHEAFSAN